MCRRRKPRLEVKERSRKWDFQAEPRVSLRIHVRDLEVAQAAQGTTVFLPRLKGFSYTHKSNSMQARPPFDRIPWVHRRTGETTVGGKMVDRGIALAANGASDWM